MPHDVTMPQLGMAQDAGTIVSWLKDEGAEVAEGDLLFEVETDKATLEVEALASGFLTNIAATVGEEVAVGAVIARISETAADTEDAAPGQASPAPVEAPAEKPAGTHVAMPQLGMAQDAGLLVAWHKRPGDAVSADDILFEVETDKSTMEVEAGIDGFLAATFAHAGENVLVGETVAIISSTSPSEPFASAVTESVSGAVPKTAPEEPSADAVASPAAPPITQAQAPVTPQPPRARASQNGRILASPKLRRLAAAENLDLALLADAGHLHPYHTRDLETLRRLSLEAAQETTPSVATASVHLVAETAVDGSHAIAEWAASTHGVSARRCLASLFAGALHEDAPFSVAVETRQGRETYLVSKASGFSQVVPSDEDPIWVLRDYRGSRLKTVALGAEAHPVVTLTDLPTSGGVRITLESAPNRITPSEALMLITTFADCIEEPLRHIL
ncbi:pyruvate dehydrogenase [Roseobacter sp. YSTF-M11]|uniref:Pyruvate dehydrogenase n=1 Tax=Roseobacter insulae TaxID=2859783 RepID=A0A9X1K0E1_9RHOB|nr:biotin/lipoyl-containing protein [Roseobacter insulae]MBW4706378.1 pyruvate dehydrogenase [Roseobacter insulae]